MRFSSKSRAACFYCISLDLLICIIFYVDQITCRCWGRQSADARHAKSRSDATNLHGAGASNLTDNTINNLKVDKRTKSPVNPVIYDYYIRKCASKKKIVAVGAVMHKICNIIFAMLRDNKPFELITPEEHCEQYLAAHPDKAPNAA